MEYSTIEKSIATSEFIKIYTFHEEEVKIGCLNETAGVRSNLSLDFVECLGEIFNQLVAILNSHGETDQGV